MGNQSKRTKRARKLQKLLGLRHTTCLNIIDTQEDPRTFLENVEAKPELREALKALHGPKPAS